MDPDVPCQDCICTLISLGKFCLGGVIIYQGCKPVELPRISNFINPVSILLCRLIAAAAGTEACRIKAVTDLSAASCIIISTAAFRRVYRSPCKSRESFPRCLIPGLASVCNSLIQLPCHISACKLGCRLHNSILVFIALSDPPVYSIQIIAVPDRPSGGPFSCDPSCLFCFRISKSSGIIAAGKALFIHSAYTAHGSGSGQVPGIKAVFHISPYSSCNAADFLCSCDGSVIAALKDLQLCAFSVSGNPSDTVSASGYISLIYAVSYA